MSTLLELLLFLKQRKKYWLWPLFIIMVALSLLMLLAQGSVFAPFIYSLF